jgi:N-acyl-D-amino-acid deacylase
VIEAVGGADYETYVREHVLAPLGIERMWLGKTRLAHRVPDEVRYFDPGQGASVFAEDLGETVPKPYGAWCLEAMDAHGGWLACASDLARFAAAFDDPDDCPVLEADSIRQMFARPPGAAGFRADGSPKAAYYALGWMVRPTPDGGCNTWHTGSLPGSAAVLIRRHDGRNFVALMNARVSPHAERLTRAIDPRLHQAADQVTEWPDRDLF